MTPITKSSVLELIEEQEYQCALTGKRLTPATASLDHIIPRSKGGEDIIENCQVIHMEVNRIKGVMTNDELIALCRVIVEVEDEVAHPDGELPFE